MGCGIIVGEDVVQVFMVANREGDVYNKFARDNVWEFGKLESLSLVVGEFLDGGMDPCRGMWARPCFGQRHRDQDLGSGTRVSGGNDCGL